MLLHDGSARQPEKFTAALRTPERFLAGAGPTGRGPIGKLKAAAAPASAVVFTSSVGSFVPAGGCLLDPGRERRGR